MHPPIIFEAIADLLGLGIGEIPDYSAYAEIHQ